MDFSNFGKIKKIFYIVAIISMLLSIKSRVLGSTNVSLDDLPAIPEVYEGQNFVIYKNTAGTYYYVCILNGLVNDTDHVLFDTNSKTLTFPSGSGKTYRTPVNNGTSWTFFDDIQSSNNIDRYGYNIGELLISSVNIYNPSDTEIVFEQNFSTVIAPAFDNVTEIENGNPDGVFISPADYLATDNLYFHLLQIDTGLSNSDQSIYYYSDKTFILNKDSDYYSTWYDPSIDGYYYYIPRYKLGLSQNTSYLYVLNNSKQQIQNSYGLYAKDVANGIYDVVQSDTAGVITATEEESDRMKNIEQMLVNNQDSINNINDSLTNTTASEETETDVESSLNYSNENPTISNLRGGFFTRLSAMLANLTNYNLRQDTAISVPLPHSNKNLTFHSIDIYNNVPEPLKTIINLFWVFIFNFYLFKFINHLYISITTGKILKDFNAKNEVITDQML